MIEVGQIRSFKDKGLPNIKVAFLRDETKEWLCVFQEDFKYPYISMSEENIKNNTELVE